MESVGSSAEQTTTGQTVSIQSAKNSSMESICYSPNKKLSGKELRTVVNTYLKDNGRN